MTDPREPWRIAVAAAEANADAQLRYAEEVATLRKELKAAVVPSDTMCDFRERVTALEQTLRNQSAQLPAQIEPSIPPVIAWLIFIIILWLAAVSGVIAGRIGFESEATEHPAETSIGGFRT